MSAIMSAQVYKAPCSIDLLVCFAKEIRGSLSQVSDTAEGQALMIS